MFGWFCKSWSKKDFLRRKNGFYGINLMSVHDFIFSLKYNPLKPDGSVVASLLISFLP